MSNLQPRGKQILRDISPRSWEHPGDAAALATLRSVPGLPALTRKLVGVTTEKSLYLLHIASAVRVGEVQFPRLNNLYRGVCERLDVGDRPALFVSQAPFLNAGAIGADNPFITINSSALGAFDDAELSTILAHEVGHCLSGHVLYKTLLQLLLRVPMGMIKLPGAGIALTAIIAALAEWDRKSELTADRAGALGAQEPQASYTVLMKLAGGTDLGQMNSGAFLEQAQEYHDSGQLIDSVHKLLNVLWRSHPFPVVRLAEIKTWIDADHYQQIINGDFVRKNQDGQEDVGEKWREAQKQYRHELHDSKDPIANAANVVLDKVDELGEQLKGIFGSMFGK